ncbi:uncharacterized protein LOC126037245 [Accipiter gentilis]|nr:uncharacterized protein LOC126037245 [Accipiter gentilis]
MERLEALEKEQRLLQQAKCQQQQQLGKRRQPGMQSSSDKSALKGRPSAACAGEEVPNSIQPTVLRATLAEDQELKEVAETVVQEVLERVKALDQSVRVLRKAPHEVRGRLFASARRPKPLDTSADRRDKIRLVAQEIVANVLESFGEHLVPSTSEAAEPGPAGRQKLSELVAGRTSRAGKSGEERWREAELASSDRASSQSSIDKRTKEAVESVSSTLSSFVASQFEQDFRLSCEIAKESIQNAISRVQQLDAELIGYAKTIVLEILETVRKKLEEERKSKQKSEKLQPREVLPPLSLPAIVTPSEEAGQLKEESSRDFANCRGACGPSK